MAGLITDPSFELSGGDEFPQADFSAASGWVASRHPAAGYWTPSKTEGSFDYDPNDYSPDGNNVGYMNKGATISTDLNGYKIDGGTIDVSFTTYPRYGAGTGEVYLEVDGVKYLAETVTRPAGAGGQNIGPAQAETTLTFDTSQIPNWESLKDADVRLVFKNTNGTQWDVDNVSATATPICFARGTMIRTERGEVAIEELQAGDLVQTRDNGLQPIRWIGSSTRKAVGGVAPILIREGTMGNARDLRVSPQHRMLVSGWRAELLFGEETILVAAKHLVNDHSIIRVEGGEIEYFHILFDQHEVVYAEGALAESFHPGAEGQKSLNTAQAKEILELFPELEGKFENYGKAAYPSLKRHEALVLSGNPDFLS